MGSVSQVWRPKLCQKSAPRRASRWPKGTLAMVDDGTRPGRCCCCFWTTLVLGTMLGAALFVTTGLHEKPVRPRGRPTSTLLDIKPLGASSRMVPRSLSERLNRTLQRRIFFSSSKGRKGRNPALPVAHANRPARSTAVGATGGLFGLDGPTTCRSSQSAVCKRCIAAPREGRALAVGPARGRTPGPPQGRCPTSYQWSWNKPLEANDAVRRLPTHPPIHHLPTHPRPCADLVTHVRPWLGRATACLGCVRCAAPRRCTSRAWRSWRSGGRATGLRSCAAAPWACAPSL